MGRGVKTDKDTEQRIRELVEDGKSFRNVAQIVGVDRQVVERIAKTCDVPQKKSSTIPQSVWREWDFWTRYIRRRD